MCHQDQPCLCNFYHFINLLSVLYRFEICLFWTFPIDEVICYMVRNWLLLFRLMFLRFIPVVTFISTLFFKWQHNIPLYSICLPIHQLMGSWVVSTFLGFMNGAAYVQVFVWTCFHILFSRYLGMEFLPRHGIAGSYENSMLNV